MLYAFIILSLRAAYPFQSILLDLIKLFKMMASQMVLLINIIGVYRNDQIKISCLLDQWYSILSTRTLGGTRRNVRGT
jgi:hypothetical protein